MEKDGGFTSLPEVSEPMTIKSVLISHAQLSLEYVRALSTPV